MNQKSAFLLHWRVVYIKKKKRKEAKEGATLSSSWKTWKRKNNVAFMNRSKKKKRRIQDGGGEKGGEGFRWEKSRRKKKAENVPITILSSEFLSHPCWVFFFFFFFFSYWLCKRRVAQDSEIARQCSTISRTIKETTIKPHGE